MRFLSLSIALLLLVPRLASAQTVSAADADSTRVDSAPSPFFDQEDGQFDISGFLATKKGFMPVASVITEPAVGYGGVLGLMFLHDSIENRAARALERHPDGTLKRLPPPSMTGVGGFLTENGSWGAGAFHNAILLDDQLRSLTGFFYSGLQLDYYGSGGSFPIPIDKIAYSLDGYVFLQEILSRVADSDVFIGLNYKYMSFESEFEIDTDFELPEKLPRSFESTSAAAGMIVEYDSRNTTFTPDRGINGRTELSFYQEALGSDRNFFKGYLNLRGWTPLGRRFVMGLRSDTQFSDGATPFYMQPFVDMRGISMTRYQGQYTTTAEVELRWDFTQRWSLLGFVGSGWVAAEDLDEFKFDAGHLAGGTGFRYHISRVFGIRTGMDFAWSEDDFAFYIVNGTAWGRK